MIPTKTDRVVTGNMQGERVRMGFAEGAEKHLMNLLTDMYSDPQLACIREYANNAWDSHVAAGVTRPIEVTLPSPLSPYLTIKDYGVGLSVEDVHQLYSKYGASSKRDSNEATGFMGIGSKAALTYTSQFTVIASKDGVRVTVAVTRDEDGAGNMLIVDTSATDAGNGVEVQIPIRQGDPVAHKAEQFFAYWPQGTVLLNGAEPSHISGMAITDSITLCGRDQGGSRGQSVVVMGNVAYPCDYLSPHELGIPYAYSVVATVPIGTVAVAPSREALSYTKETMAAVEQIKTDFRKGVARAVQREIEDAPSPHAAVKALNQWRDVLGRNAATTFRYKGKAIPAAITRPDVPSIHSNLPADSPDRPRILISSNSDYKMGSASTTHAADLTYLDKAVFVTDYNMAKMTPTHKKKLRKWVAESASEDVRAACSSFVLVNFSLGAHKEWIAPERVIDWPTIHAIKLPAKERTVSGKMPGSYDVTIKVKDEVLKSMEKLGSDIDLTKPVYWLHGNYSQGRYMGGLIQNYVDEFTIVCLPENRIAKFCRENPAIKPAKSVLQAAYDAWYAALTDAQKLALAIHDEHDLGDFTALSRHVARIDDPEVVKTIKAVGNIDVGPLVQQRRSWYRQDVVMNSDKADWTNPLDAYVLYSSYAVAAHTDEVIQYLNLVYAVQSGGAA